MPIEVMQWQTEKEAHGSSWSARERTVAARMENYLDRNDCLKLDIEELEFLMGPSIGLRMMAEDNALRSDSDSSPDLGDMWSCGCPEQQRR